jgi:hypothetical protein
MADEVGGRPRVSLRSEEARWHVKGVHGVSCPQRTQQRRRNDNNVAVMMVWTSPEARQQLQGGIVVLVWAFLMAKTQRGGAVLLA